jgi:hypothetical protein
LTFRAAAVAALVWIGRELMRRWVDGPDQPQVADGWNARPPEPLRSVPGPPESTGGSAQSAEPTPAPGGSPPAKKARAKKAAAPVKPAAPVDVAATDAPAPAPAETPASSGETAPPEAAKVEPAPAKRRPRPLKATRIAKAGPPPKAAPAAKSAPATKAAPVAKAVTAPEASGPEPKKAPPGDAKGRRKAAAGAWVSPNGSGEAPRTHPVKAKLVSRLYRVPGMPLYDRTVPDRCYTTPEAAEADGFTRAAR